VVKGIPKYLLRKSSQRGKMRIKKLRKKTHQTPFELVSFVGRSSVRASKPRW